MVEEHVGKKRRKEVRQAINMSEELRKTLRFVISILALSLLLIVALYILSITGIVNMSMDVINFAPLAIAVIAMIIVVPKANRYWTLRDEYKDHLARYNITKADMKALKNNEL